MNCGRDKEMKLLGEPDTNKGAGLVERIRQGQGKTTRIYVKRFTTREIPPQPEKILVACVPVLCLLITAGGAYAVALLRRETTKIEKQLDNETTAKYMTMASEAVVQAVAYTLQTFVDSLKKQGGFTKEKQAEAFKKSKEKALEILSDTAVAALMGIYGDLEHQDRTGMPRDEAAQRQREGRQRSHNGSSYGSHDRHGYGAADRGC